MKTAIELLIEHLEAEIALLELTLNTEVINAKTKLSRQTIINFKSRISNNNFTIKNLKKY